MEKDLTNINLNFRKSAVDLTDLALGMIILGVVVSIGAVITLNIRDNRLTSLDTTSVVNETVSPTGGVFTLSNTWVQGLSEVTNASDDGNQVAQDVVIDSGNYSFSINSIDGQGTLDFTDSPFNATDINVSYTYYDTTGQDWALANNATTGISEFGNWFTILVLIGVASVILALIFMVFGNRDFSGSVNY